MEQSKARVTISFRLKAFVLVVLLSLPTSIAQGASDSLIAGQSFPSSVSSDIDAAKFPLALPSTVVLGTNTNVKWSISKFAFKDNIGADFDFDGHSNGLGTAPYSVKIEPLGRSAIFSIGFVYATNTSITFNANVDGKDYSLTRDITWLPNAKYGGRVSPTTSSDFGFETKIPDPGSDAQVTIQVRAVGSSRWETDDIGIRHKIQFDLVDRNGQSVQFGTYPEIGTWQNFTINGAKYQQSGLMLKASWEQCYPTNCYGPGVYFFKLIPISINFPKPTHSINLTCGEVFREKISSCSFTIESRGLDGTATELGQTSSVNINISKSDGSKTQIKKSFTYGQSSDIQIPSDKNALNVTISLDGENLSKQVIATPHQYTLSEQVEIKWNLSCQQNEKNISCKAMPEVKANPNFEVPKSIPYVVTRNAYSSTSKSLEQDEIENATISPNQSLSFSLKYSTLLESVSIAVDSNESGASWINKNYSEPLSSSNLTFSMSCPNNFSGQTFNCNVIAKTSAKYSSILKTELQYKTNKVNWKTIRTVNLKLGTSTKISVPNLIDNTLAIRIAFKLNGDVITSNSPNWISTKSTDNNKDVRISAIRKGLQEGCSRLPKTLNIEYVGAGPDSGGNPSRMYSVNGVFNLIIYDLGDTWNFAAYPFQGQNQVTAAQWNCGAGGLGAVLYNFFVNKRG